MAQRVLKIILPARKKDEAIKLLNDDENNLFWQEGCSDDIFVLSVLTEAEHSEVIMDIFERKFTSLAGFKLIVFPVEASIPRTDSKSVDNNLASEEQKKVEEIFPLRISREELYSDIVDSTKLTSTFISMTVLSTLVVAIGLLKDNVAVIIGAMVIAPFLGPNVALALSACLADRELGNNSLKTLVVGSTISVLIAICIGFFFGAGTDINEIHTRTQVGISDFVLALASGCAGVLAFTTGASSAVIGVMVAVALLPPLTVFGLLIGSADYSNALTALLLFCINIVCINLAGVAAFLSQGVSPRTWWQADKARKATRLSIFLWSLSSLFLIIFLLLLKYRTTI